MFDEAPNSASITVNSPCYFELSVNGVKVGGYMVDCPQRERMGYGGDGQTSLAGMMMNFKAASFYGKWAVDWRQAQNENGSLPNIAP